ncbi:hypothetical protein ES703_41476 [subsurface metagenome]|nr:hypothetical protein [Dehalococcoidia bacterium]
MTWLSSNWEWILVGFYVLEKIVKISPAVWDDILVDGIKYVLSKLKNSSRGY